MISTLNLAQVGKWYNDAVWSVDGVRSMKAKIEAAKPDYLSEPLYWAARYGNMPAVRALLKSGVDVDTDLFGGLHASTLRLSSWPHAGGKGAD